MTRERRMADVIDRVMEGLLFDPAIDLDTKRNIFELRVDLNSLIADIDKELKIKEPEMPLSPEDKDAVMKEYRSESKRNAARKAFSSGCARLEQIAAQGADIFELRAAEFESVDAILAAYHSGDHAVGDPDHDDPSTDGDALRNLGVSASPEPDADLAGAPSDAGGTA